MTERAPGDALQKGALLAGFRIEGELGRGGMGTVYRATQLSLGREVALKVLRPELSSDPEFRRRFRQEAILASRVTHPRLVRVVEVGEAAGLFYLASELVGGETLRVRLEREKRLALEDALKTIEASAEGLAALHAAGILHRDLKPDNLFLDRERGVLVGDLGIAKDTLRSAAATSVGVLVGTPAYMAPELTRGGVASAQSELYALGVVLFECLTGRVPFDSNNPVELLSLHWTEAVPSVRDERPGLPPAVDAFLARAMAKLPEERPCDARTFAAESRRLPRTEQERPDLGQNRTMRGRVSQTPASAGTRLLAVRDAPVGRPRWIGLTLLAAAIVAILAGAAYRWGARQPALTPPRAEAPAAVRPTAATGKSSLAEQICRSTFAALASSNHRIEELLEGVLKDRGAASPDELIRKAIAAWGEGISPFDNLWGVHARLRASGEPRADRLAGRTLVGIFALFLHVRTQLKGALDALSYRGPGIPYLGKRMSDQDWLESFDAGVGASVGRLLRTLPASLESSRNAAWLGGRCALLAMTRRSPEALHINELSRQVSRLAEDSLTRLGAHGPEAEPDLLVCSLVLEALKYMGIREARMKILERVVAPLEAVGLGQQVDRREEVIRALLAWNRAMLKREMDDDSSREATVRVLAECVRLRVRLTRNWAGEPEPAIDPVPGAGDSLADLLNAKASFMEVSAKRIRELAVEAGVPVPTLSN